MTAAMTSFTAIFALFSSSRSPIWIVATSSRPVTSWVRAPCTIAGTTVPLPAPIAFTCTRKPPSSEASPTKWRMSRMVRRISMPRA
jgi:hypothetical protein